MNTYMTRSTKNSQVFNIIVFMTLINMVNIEFFFLFFADETLSPIEVKGPLPIVATSFSIIWIFLSLTFIGVEYLLAAFSRAKPTCCLSRSLSLIGFIAKLTYKRDFSIPMITRFSPTIPGTKMNSSRFVFCNVTRSFFKRVVAPLANKRNEFVTRVIVAFSRAKFCSIVFERDVACWTYHLMSLAFATVKVNHKEVPNA